MLPKRSAEELTMCYRFVQTLRWMNPTSGVREVHTVLFFSRIIPNTCVLADVQLRTPRMYAACAGPIPRELGQLSVLEQLSLHSNKLTGEYIVFVLLILSHIYHNRMPTMRWLEIVLFLYSMEE